MIRNSIALSAFLLMLSMSACVPALEDMEGIACAQNGKCPDGLVCVANRCERGASAADAADDKGNTPDTQPVQDTGSDVVATSDAAPDAGVDAEVDAAFDAAGDAVADAAADVVDATVDATVDAVDDTSTDVAAADAVTDVSSDVGIDVAIDTGIDAPVDAGADTSGDATVKGSLVLSGATDLVTTELPGSPVTFTVRLSAQPSSNVSVVISSSNPNKGTVSPTTLTFTSSNWDTPQAVTLTGVNDGVITGDMAYSVNFGPTTSADPAFNGLSTPSVMVTNQDAVLTRVSLSSAGVEGNALSGGSNSTVWLGAPRISDDARYVAYASLASNLSLLDGDSLADIYLHDRQKHTTELISVSGTTKGNGASTRPLLAGDGTVAAFKTLATNLASGAGCIVRDLKTGTLTRFSTDANCGPHDISTDGRYVLFTEPNGGGTLLKRFDRQSSLSTTLSAVGTHVDPRMSGTGRWVSFRTSSALDAADTNNKPDIYLLDLDLPSPLPVRISLASNGSQLPNGVYQTTDAADLFQEGDGNAMSADGVYHAFATFDPDAALGDTNSEVDLYLIKRENGVTTSTVRASALPTPPSPGRVYQFDLSNDGRYLAFEFRATVSTANTAVWVYDRTSGTLTNQAKTNNGVTTQNSHMFYPMISGNGYWLAFWGFGTNLVPGDNNGVYDVFVGPRL